MTRRLSIWLVLPVAAWLAGAGCGGYGGNLSAGLDAMRRANYAEAVHHFKRATEHNPQSAAAYANLGLAYWKLGATELAIEALTMASDLDVNDPRPRLLLAEVLQERKRWDEAREVLTRVNNGLPERADMLTRFAQLEYRAGNVDQAAAQLEHALRLDPKYGPALYNSAVLARDQRHDTLAAMRFFSRYLTVATDQPRIDKVHEQLALLRQPFRPPPPPPAPAAARVPVSPPPPPVAALPASAPAVPVTVPAPAPTTTTQPPPPPPRNDAAAAAELLAQARRAMDAKAYDEALVALAQARALAPQNPDVVWTMASLYDQSLGQPQKAEVLLRDFVRQFPDDPRAVAARRRLDRQAESAAPPAATARVPVTSAATTTTRLPAAAAAATAPPMTATEAWEKGLAAHEAGAWAEAERYYETVLTLDPSFASAAFNLGVVHKAQGDLPAARAAFRRAATIDPQLAKAHYMVAVVAREQGDRHAAIDAGKRSLAADPRDHKTHYLLGLLYREALRYDLARYHFKRAMDLAPDRDASEKARTALETTPAPGSRR